MFLNEEPKEEKIIKIINELEYNNKEDDYKNEKTERYININTENNNNNIDKLNIITDSSDKNDEGSSKSNEFSDLNSSEEIILDWDNIIENLFNNLTLEDNKDNIKNNLNNNDIFHMNLLDRIEKKYSVDVGKILNNPIPTKRKDYYPKEDEYEESKKEK